MLADNIQCAKIKNYKTGLINILDNAVITHLPFNLLNCIVICLC